MKDVVAQRRAKNIALMYHDADVKLKEELCKHLKPMQRNGYIQIMESAANARTVPLLDIILALISPDFSDDDTLVKGVHFAEYHTQARVILILLRAVNLTRDLPVLAGKQALPRNGKPIDEWKSRDKILCEIVQEIYKVVKD